MLFPSSTVTPALAEVLEELRAEYRRMPNLERRVFTRNGMSIAKGTLRHAFDKAVRHAKVGDFQYTDFCHCARTRWAANGLLFEVGEIGIGHKIRGVAGRYINLSDDDIREVFREMFTKCEQRNNATVNRNEGDSVSA